MRVTRSRTAAKKRPAHGAVDLDSDEFEDILAAADKSPLGRTKRRRQNSKAAPTRSPAQRRRIAAARADADSSDDERYEDDMEELEELEGISDQHASDAADSSDSDSPSSDAADSDYDATPSKQREGKKHNTTQKKLRRKRESTARLCTTYAKAQYGLTDRDLAQLTDIEYRDNPHYPGGHPMKLYLVRELEQLARQKQEEQDAAAAVAEQRGRERAEAARAKRAAAAEAAAEAVKAIGAKSLKPCDEKHGSVRLPDTCLAKIMTCIAATLEPGGLRGPSCVARELANAALVCWDFYHAIKAGFVALAEVTSTLQQPEPPEPEGERDFEAKVLVGLSRLPGPDTLGGWAFWDSLLQDPTSYKLPQLKEALKQLGIPVSGTKPQLVLRLLDAFGLTAPSAAPAQLLRALVFERSSVIVTYSGTSADREMLAAMSKLNRAGHAAGDSYWQVMSANGFAGVRAQLSKYFTSLNEVKAGAEAALKAHHVKQWAAQRAAAAARAAAATKCRCGKNAPAEKCTRGCCGVCCRQLGAAAGAVRCIRHKTGGLPA